MTERIALDASPLSLLCQRSTARQVSELRVWLAARIADGSTVFVPEIADYEVRRELLRAGKLASVRRLDKLIEELAYLPITTGSMRRAAQFWADARNQGSPTAPPDALDADVILAALAESVDAVVATNNIRHLARFVPALRWGEID